MPSAVFAQDGMRVTRPPDNASTSSGTAGGGEALHGQVGKDVQVGSSDRNTLGFKSTPEGSEVYPARVDDVDPQSDAYKKGLRVGDKIIDGSASADGVKLAVERNGQTLEIAIQQNTANAGATQKNFSLGASQSAFAGNADLNASTQPLQGAVDGSAKRPLQANVSVQDLQHLSEHDVVIIIDRSGSMWARDCPYFTTRWEWCGDQANQMMHQTVGYINDVTIVLFSTGFQIFRNCNLKKLPMVFMLNHPFGSTETAQALQSQIAEYFYRKQATQGHCRPVVIAIITDGVPDNPMLLKAVIINATKFMQDPNEISITFMQVGKDSFGSNLLQDLDQGLVYQGAKYDIVETKTFNQLKSEGLTKALVDAINRTRTENKIPYPLQEPDSKSKHSKKNKHQQQSFTPQIVNPPAELGKAPKDVPMPALNPSP